MAATSAMSSSVATLLATRTRREGKGEEEVMTVSTQAEELPVFVSLRCVHRDKESGYVAQFAHGGREGRGGS
eukprot:5251232-Pleurochrysis_carterae.AAC.1